MKNLFVMIALLVGLGIIIAVVGVIINLYFTSVLPLICYITGGVFIFVAIILAVVGFIKSTRPKI